MMPFVLCNESIRDVDKSDYMHFVNSVQWHCAILMKTTRLNEDIDRALIINSKNISIFQELIF